ncbi:DUF3955 domain-containing protein [Clostridium sp.]|uniref:DUF3955 domain-containing protein n=1 Tax=Clostridium sp. TaxID=1506 RepID=UPI0025C5B18D|nr:DUF3955 domain-containing protein [Clostridium sp.]
MKKYIISLTSFILSISCIIAFNIIGSDVAPDGTLMEPFFLIPLFYIFLFIGIISLFISFIWNFKKNYK